MTASSTVMLSSLAVAPIPEPTYEGHSYKIKWLSMGSSGGGLAIGGGTDNSVGSAGGTFGSSTNYDLVTYADKTVQFSGLFGTSILSSAQLLGSNDGGANWFLLKDAFGNAISMSSGGVAQITESVQKVLPVTPGGDGGTAINCYLFGRKMVI